MKEYYDIEKSVLSCLLIKPELMKKVILKDEHFMKHKRVWSFMKACYKKFGTFDFGLMYSVCSNKNDLIDSMTEIVDCELTASHFEEYQKRMIEMYEELDEEKWAVEKIYALATDLYVRNINLGEFANKLNKIYEDLKSYEEEEE